MPLAVTAAAAAATRRSMLASKRKPARMLTGSATRASLESPIFCRSLARSLSPRISCVGIRTLSTTCLRLNKAQAPATCPAPSDSKVLATYDGPLARTFTRLKLFSLGSLGLATILTPILLLAPGEISMAGRLGLSLTALATSGVSTALIAWIGTPYVGTMRLLEPNRNQVIMELNTVSWRLRPQRTLVYQPEFLRPTSRPFATWEITNNPSALCLDDAHKMHIKIAETFDVKSGTSLGEWMVKYDTHANQTTQTDRAKAVANVQVRGKPTRYFNVHEELLDENWQVLG